MYSRGKRLELAEHACLRSAFAWNSNSSDVLTLIIKHLLRTVV